MVLIRITIAILDSSSMALNVQPASDPVYVLRIFFQKTLCPGELVHGLLMPDVFLLACFKFHSKGNPSFRLANSFPKSLGDSVCPHRLMLNPNP